jgi:predicted short-subunit dehydrogenase-like oxidoreductase (DUF2520 family)
MKRAAVAIVGNGKLARALRPALRAAGHPVRSVASRPPTRQGAGGARTVGDATIVLLAVPDSALPEVAQRLAREEVDWSKRVVLHHAGALGPGPLAPLAKRGAHVGVLHPLQSLADPGTARRTLPGSAARIEGDPRAVRTARQLARDLGLRPLRLARRSTAATRGAYHAAAALVANDLLALLDGGVELLVEAGVDRRQALSALTKLAQGVLANAEALGIERALTGPVARGDDTTVAVQLRRLTEHSPDSARAHRALSLRLLAIATRAGALSPAAARRMRKTLDSGPNRMARVIVRGPARRRRR